ncbi:hypothetical protein MHTCC0001_35610 [Flavobacteriaceae bacterium MHTCC 0001]
MIAVPLSDTQNQEFLEILNLLKELDGWEKELKKAIAESITSTAELMHKVYGKLNTLANRCPSSIVYINKIVDKLRDTATDYINTNPNTCTWGDLFNMWLFELGPNPALFELNDLTTQDLMIQEGVSKAREKAIAKINNNDFSITFEGWHYGQDEFYDGVQNGNLATSFLGSYTTVVTITTDSDGNRILNFSVNNPSTWESATRLRIDNDGDGNHDGIFPNKERGEGINIGGNFNQRWTWTEKI